MERLIDEDELIKNRVENDPVVIAAKCTPTAYDLDKVVEKLEELKEEKMLGSHKVMLKEAIEIVKDGA